MTTRFISARSWLAAEVRSERWAVAAATVAAVRKVLVPLPWVPSVPSFGLVRLGWP